MRIVLQWFVVILFSLVIAACGGGSSSIAIPVIVTGLAAAPANASPVTLVWTAVSGASSYNVYRNGTLLDTVSVTSYQDTLSTSGAYAYTVTWVANTVESAQSAAVVVMISGNSPLSLSNVTTLAGKADVSGSADSASGDLDGITTARFYYPNSITSAGTSLYVSDYLNGTIRRLDKTTGIVSTVLNSSTSAPVMFYGPAGMVSDGTFLYVAQHSNHTIAKVDLASGTLETIAGTGTAGSTDGVGSAATFNQPTGLALIGSNLFVADTVNQTIRKVDLSTTAYTVTTIAGLAGTAGSADGVSTAARFYWPSHLATDGANLYVTDNYNNLVRMVVNPSITAYVFTLAGKAGVPGYKDAVATAALFNGPNGIACDGENLYVADSKNNMVRQIVLASGTVTTLAGSLASGATDGPLVGASFSFPNGLLIDGGALYVADTQNYTVRKFQ